MDLDLVDGGPAPLLPPLGVPGQHLLAVAARRPGAAGRAPVHVGAEEGAEGVEVGHIETQPDLLGDGRRGERWADGDGTVFAHALFNTSNLTAMPGFDPQEMVARFRARAEAVRTRGMPPIEGPERQRFREQAQRDFADYAMIGDAEAELVDGILTLRIDLRPPGAEEAGAGEGTGASP